MLLLKNLYEFTVFSFNTMFLENDTNCVIVYPQDTPWHISSQNTPTVPTPFIKAESLNNIFPCLKTSEYGSQKNSQIEDLLVQLICHSFVMTAKVKHKNVSALIKQHVKAHEIVKIQTQTLTLTSAEGSSARKKQRVPTG